MEVSASSEWSMQKFTQKICVRNAELFVRFGPEYYFRLKNRLGTQFLLWMRGGTAFPNHQLVGIGTAQKQAS